MKSSLRIALAQINPIVGDLAGNAQRIINACQRAVTDYQADIVVFPELALCAYPPEDLLFREGFHAAMESAVQHIAQQTKKLNITLVLGYSREHQDQHGQQQRYNAATVLSQGKSTLVYDKHALPNYGVFDELRYFQAGDQVGVFDCHGYRLGLTICEDIWQVTPAQQACAAGAQIILNLNASPFHLGKAHKRLEILRQRIKETQCPIIYVNMVGGQDELVFDGGSLALDADGAVIVQAPVFVESITAVEWDGKNLQALSNNNATLSDDALLYEALVCGVRDYVIKNGFKGVLLGLSGGIDSAVTLAIAVDALGAEAVQAVMLPSRHTAQISLDDAALMAQLLKVDYQVLSIEATFTALQQTLAPLFGDLPTDVTEENMQARCRGILLMALSNKQSYHARRLLLTTGNKSEMAMGYATLYGDMAGGFAPLKDVSKQWVYRLAHYRNSLGMVIPQRIITRPPSAELAPDQKDEDSLPPYEMLDQILSLYVEQERSIEAIVAQGFDATIVRDVVRKVNLNEYKRRQSAPGVKVTLRAFGRERRYPITNAYDK
ncbi:MAG: NAD+ synthase [Gammaproteobacteria bacterium]|nr:NAD+ synthase [Gammaproteobacteria bacterium]